MPFRSNLLAVLSAFALSACNSNVNNEAETLLSTTQPPAATAPVSLHYHPEYCVLATDDAELYGNELAYRLFYGKAFEAGAYHSLGAQPLLTPSRERIGHLPDGVLENGLLETFPWMISDVCGGGSNGYRAAIIFTGPHFAEQAKESLRDVESSTMSLRSNREGIRYMTDAGQVVEVSLTEKDTARVFVLTR